MECVLSREMVHWKVGGRVLDEVMGMGAAKTVWLSSGSIYS